MTPDERQVIEDLFAKLADLDRRGGLREPEADALIAGLAARQPGAAYYMAQAIVAQEGALTAAQARIASLETAARAPQPSGGFLSGLFGVPAAADAPRREPRTTASASASGGPWGAARGGLAGGQAGGGGFLAGAAQTAVGVAGGVMLGSFLADMLTPDAALAAEPGADGLGAEPGGDALGAAPEEAAGTGDVGGDAGGDMGGDFGGDF